ncbi:MAG: hypothetical protein ACJAS1_005849 [Oleiphilaceae bacterium]|jgi:hypothetical protein
MFYCWLEPIIVSERPFHILYRLLCKQKIVKILSIHLGTEVPSILDGSDKEHLLSIESDVKERDIRQFKITVSVEEIK